MNCSSKRVVLITGGSSGIGFEMARQMAAMQSRVIICGRSQEKLDHARKRLPELETIRCDITNAKDRDALYREIAKKHHGLNMLINNAGITRRYVFEKETQLECKITREWETNYLAPVLLIKQMLPLLISNAGTIVNVTSGLVYAPLCIEPNYCATKAALHSMTVSLRLCLKDKGVKVREIFYPAVDTPFQNGHAPDFAIQPDKAAEIALKGLNQGKDEIHVKMAGVLYWLSRLMPQRSISLINRAVGKNVDVLLSGEIS